MPDEFGISSLCPVLGKMHAQVYSGVCPYDTENPDQKEIRVSFWGPRPYITYDPVGGSDFILVGLFAKKHGFIPIFVPARSIEVVKANGTISGMLHSVMTFHIKLFSH